jgi:hypothetical protein
MATESTPAEQRTSEQGHTFGAADVRDFLAAVLLESPASGRLDQLLCEHIEQGRYDPSVIARGLRPMIEDIIATATDSDWEVVAGDLIENAREALADKLAESAR